MRHRYFTKVKKATVIRRTDCIYNKKGLKNHDMLHWMMNAEFLKSTKNPEQIEEEEDISLSKHSMTNDVDEDVRWSGNLRTQELKNSKRT